MCVKVRKRDRDTDTDRGRQRCDGCRVYQRGALAGVEVGLDHFEHLPGMGFKVES